MSDGEIVPVKQGPLLPAHVKAVVAQLDSAAVEYLDAKDEFEAARVAFELAREKFAGVRTFANQLLTTFDMISWQRLRPEVRFAAMSAGDAIAELLRDHAWHSARAHLDDPKNELYEPFMTLDDIVTELDAGGFEFRSTARGREVNAALINLANVEKRETDGRYAVADHARLLTVIGAIGSMVKLSEESKARRSARKEKAAAKARTKSPGA